MEKKFISYKVTDFKENSKRITGQYIYGICVFNFSLCKQKGMNETWRGTVSINDNEGGTLKKEEIVKDDIIKIVPICTSIYVNGGDENKIKNAIIRGAERIYGNYPDLIRKQNHLAVRPSTITLSEAIIVYGERYVAEAHKRAFANGQLRLKQMLKNSGAKFPSTPMSELNKKEVNKCIQNLSEKNIKELSSFWDYCLREKHCKGINQISLPPRKRRIKKSHIGRDYLVREEIDKLYAMISEQSGGPLIGIALILGAGLNETEALDLKWADLKICGKNYILLKKMHMDKNGQLQDYSRPLFPQAARIVSRRFNSLCAEYSENTVKGMPIVSYVDNPMKKYPRKTFLDALNKLMKENFFDAKEYNEIVQLDKSPTAIRIFRSTYRYILEERCNLSDDPGLLNYLMGKSLYGDTTSYSYRDFLSEDAQLHIYSILKSQDIKEANKTKIVEDEYGIITIKPDYSGDNYEIIIEDDIETNESLIIECEHGGTGIIKVN